MATKGTNRWSPGILLGAVQSDGGGRWFVSMSADAVKFLFRRPFQWREFLEQSWFVARVSLARRCWWRSRSRCWCLYPQHLAAGIGCCGSVGCGCGVRCGDPGRSVGDGVDRGRCGRDGDVRRPGSRTIREEIDAMEVLGINPVQRLVTPRMLARVWWRYC